MLDYFIGDLSSLDQVLHPIYEISGVIDENLDGVINKGDRVLLRNLDGEVVASREILKDFNITKEEFLETYKYIRV